MNDESGAGTTSLTFRVVTQLLAMAIHAFVLKFVWDWFVVQSDRPEMPYWVAGGIMFLVWGTFKRSNWD